MLQSWSYSSGACQYFSTTRNGSAAVLGFFMLQQRIGFLYVWNESVRKRLVDDSEFCVFQSMKSRSIVGWYRVSLLQQLVRIFYNHTVAD